MIGLAALIVGVLTLGRTVKGKDRQRTLPTAGAVRKTLTPGPAAAADIG